MRRDLRKLVLGLSLVIGSQCFAKSPVQILSFQANAIAVLQTSGSTWSAQASWTPRLALGGFGIRGDLGAAYLKDAFGDRFFAINFEGLVVVPLIPILSVEAGGGMNTWTGGRGTSPILSANLVIDLANSTVDRIFSGYSRLLLPGNGTNEFKIGIGFIF